LKKAIKVAANINYLYLFFIDQDCCKSHDKKTRKYTKLEPNQDFTVLCPY